MTQDDSPHGYVLSEAALYSFSCQDVYPDVISFAAAIPLHLRSLFLIPIQVDYTIASDTEHAVRSLAMKMTKRQADGSGPSGGTEESDLFGTKTFVNDDIEPTVPNTSPGSIFDIDGADSLTHHQEYDFDQNIQVPSETTFMEDIDTTNFPRGGYPYYTNESPVRHSSIKIKPILIVRIAVKPEQLETHAPKKIKDNAKTCSVDLTSYNKKTRVFTFSVDCGNSAKIVQASLSDIDQVAMSCDCPFWKWNGPEFHAKENSFMLGQPFGTASPPNLRDPERKYWLCKHAYAVLRRLDSFVQEIVEENWEKDDDELLREVDEEWDRLEGMTKVPLEEIEEEDLDIETAESEESGESEEVDSDFVEESEETPSDVQEPESNPVDYDVEESDNIEKSDSDVDDSDKSESEVTDYDVKESKIDSKKPKSKKKSEIDYDESDGEQSQS